MCTSDPQLYCNIPENNLLQMTRSGNEEAFEEIIQRYRLRMYETALAILSSPMAAEAVVSDTFQKAYENLDDFHDESLFLTWLCRQLICNARKKLQQNNSVQLNNHD